MAIKHTKVFTISDAGNTDLMICLTGMEEM